MFQPLFQLPIGEPPNVESMMYVYRRPDLQLMILKIDIKPDNVLDMYEIPLGELDDIADFVLTISYGPDEVKARLNDGDILGQQFIMSVTLDDPMEWDDMTQPKWGGTVKYVAKYDMDLLGE